MMKNKLKWYLFVAYEMYVCGQDKLFVDYEALNGSQGLYEKQAFEAWLNSEGLHRYLNDKE